MLSVVKTVVLSARNAEEIAIASLKAYYIITVWVQNFEGSIFRGFEESSLIRNFRRYQEQES